MTEKSKKIKPLLAAAVLVLVAAALVFAWQTLRPKANQGEKTITVQVVHSDGSTKEATVHTDAENLEQVLLALEELEVVGEDGPFGLYVRSADGEAASDSEQTYWRLSQDGVDLPTGAKGQMVADGDHYELTLSTW